MFRRLRRKAALPPYEQDRLREFAAMSLNDVRRRADEFEKAERQYTDWLRTRRDRRAHAPDPDEQDGYAPEAAYGHPSKRWRELEQELRRRGVWEVQDLGESEQLRWAKRLNALSESLSRPHRRRIGPTRPAAQSDSPDR